MLPSASDSNLFNLNGRSAVGARSSAACNPFFDNIRQNRELQHGITEKIPLDLHFLTESQKQNILPPFLQEIAGKDEKTVADQLAHDFFDIEKAEQTRLMATMRQHAAESSMDPRQNNTMVSEGADATAKDGASSAAAAEGDSPVQLSSAYSRVEGVDSTTSLSASSFPFSIAAAIERGSENRYNNIWTYEHSRVPVSTGGTCGEDKSGASVSSYLNGSFVQPLREFGAHRSYIATQAPLPTTFETFWNAVWQQNSRTIAMLTREYESGRVQSHNYWSEEAYGTTVKLKTIEEVELTSKGEICTSSKKREKQDDGAAGGFFFSSTSAEEKDPNEPVMVRRKLLLSIVGSDEAPKEVTHFQYIGWPDYSIPEDPEAILVFMDLVNQAQNDAHLALASSADVEQGKYKDNKTSATGPLVLHCSAGVGRTGTYVVIDSVLDVLRKDRRKSLGLPPLALWDNGSSYDHAEADDVDMTPAGKSSATFEFNTLQSPFKSKSSPFFSGGPERSSASTSATALASPPGEARHSALGYPRRPEDGMLSPKSSSSNLQRGGSMRSKLKRELSPSADMDLDEPPAFAGSDSVPHDSTPSAMWSPSGAQSGPQGGFSFSRAAGSLRREARGRGLRRQRSDTSDDASVTTTDADTDRPSSLEDRESPMPQAVSMASSGSASARGSFSHQSRLGSISAEEGTPASAYRHAEGMDTPSRAMDGMNLGFSSSSRSSHISTPTSPFTFGSGGSGSGGGAGSAAASTAAPTPSSFKLSLPSGAGAAAGHSPQQSQQQSNTTQQQQEPRRFSIARTTHSSASEARSSPNPPGSAPKSTTRGSISMDPATADGKTGNAATLCASPAATTTASSSTPHSSSSAAPASSPLASGAVTASTSMAPAGEKDLIRHATHVAREQRMSSVQTQRQYVFCYLAVVKGVLREVQREREAAGAGAGGQSGQGGSGATSSPFFS
jgi:protein tyrosine phosphatase